MKRKQLLRIPYGNPIILTMDREDLRPISSFEDAFQAREEPDIVLCADGLSIFKDLTGVTSLNLLVSGMPFPECKCVYFTRHLGCNWGWCVNANSVGYLPLVTSTSRFLDQQFPYNDHIIDLPIYLRIDTLI